MSIKQTLKAIREAGMAGAWDSDYKEWRVTFTAKDIPSYERREAVACYCGDDHNDAIATAQAMRSHFERYGDHG